MKEKSFAGRTAVMAGGVLLGVIGSRLFPPLFAAASGAAHTAAGRDPFALLEQDHRRILESLDAMQREASSSATRRGAVLLAFKRTLAKHALAEEDVVYPMLQREAAAVEESKHLYAEHAEMKVLIFELETALMRGEPWGESVSRLRDLIANHIREEETVEFPRLRQAMGDRGKTGLAAQIHREEAMVL